MNGFPKTFFFSWRVITSHYRTDWGNNSAIFVAKSGNIVDLYHRSRHTQQLSWMCHPTTLQSSAAVAIAVAIAVICSM